MIGFDPNAPVKRAPEPETEPAKAAAAVSSTLEVVEEEAPAAVPEPEPTKPKKPKKIRATFHMPETLVEECRDACYWVPGLTLAGFATDALTEALENLKAEKGPFEKRPESFKGGRPIGS
jgi:hypothetical protein